MPPAPSNDRPAVIGLPLQPALSRPIPAHLRRRAIASFTLLAILSTAFCISVYQRVDQVLDATALLAERDIPTQQVIAALETDIVAQEPILYEYYATEDTAKFTAAIATVRSRIAAGLNKLEGEFPNDPRLQTMHREREAIDGLAVSLDENLAAPDTDWDAARESLRAITTANTSMSQALDSLLTELHTGVKNRAQRVSNLVSEVVVITILSSLGMIVMLTLVGRFVLRSLIDAWHHRRLAYFPERNETAILSLDGDGRVQYANPSAHRLAASLGNDGCLGNLLPETLGALLSSTRQSPERSHRCEQHRSGRILDVQLHFLDDLDLFHVYINDVTAQRLAQQQIAHAAYHDQLTDLGNRRALFARLSTEIAECRSGMIALTSMARYTQILETIGHVGADTLLTAVAHRLRNLQLGGVEVEVYRLERDSFCIWSPNLELDVLGSALGATGEQPIVVGAHEFFVQLRAGVSRYPEHGNDPELIVKHAELALSHTGDSTAIGIYSPQFEIEAMQRQQVEQLLRRAVGRQELFLAFQPKCDLQTGRVNGAEALARWRSPELGLVSPAVFIPIAESTGIISDIGWWALRTAAAQWKSWERRGTACGPIAVNIAVSHLLSRGFVDRLSALLAEIGIPAAAIEIEITESEAMQDAAATETTLRRLSEIGIKVAIDDFGTGYSSFAYLKRLAIDTVKIDQAFIRPMSGAGRDLALVAAMIDMAHRLDLKVVAEGVETAEQLRALREHRCDIAQGYYIARPMEAQAFLDFLTSQQELAAAQRPAA